jgi:hypothetical protein
METGVDQHCQPGMTGACTIQFFLREEAGSYRVLNAGVKTRPSISADQGLRMPGTSSNQLCFADFMRILLVWPRSF